MKKLQRRAGGRPRGIPCKWKGQKLPWKRKKINPRRRVFTDKMKKWADIYMETGSLQKASIEAYNIDMTDEQKGKDYANSLACVNRKKPEIMRYIESVTQRAAKTVVFLCENAENESIRLRAAQDILDRVGFKPTERLEIDDKRELNDEDYEAIRRVQSILKGVKIEEIKPVEIKEAETYDNKQEN
jgi:hypothetical protein